MGVDPSRVRELALALLDAIWTVSRLLRGCSSLLLGDQTRVLQPTDVVRMVAAKSGTNEPYVLTAATCAIAGLVLKCDFRRALSLSIGTAGILLMAGLRLGSLRQNQGQHTNPMTVL